jgi:uncharacterized membrane protein
MKKVSGFIASTIVAGILVVTPVYLACLLLLRAMKSLSKVMGPLSKLLPEWLPAEGLLSLLIVLVGCFLIGLSVRTAVGRGLVDRLQTSLFRKIPGYELFRSLTQRMAGRTQDQTWKPALAEIEEALVPAFIIEELADGSFTVFVPAVPTPVAGAIYILSADRVHPLDVPFTQVVKTISRWGSGAKELVAAMDKNKVPIG